MNIRSNNVGSFHGCNTSVLRFPGQTNIRNIFGDITFFQNNEQFYFFFTTVSFSLSHQKSSKITFAICLLSTAKF